MINHGAILSMWCDSTFHYIQSMCYVLLPSRWPCTHSTTPVTVTLHESRVVVETAQPNFGGTELIPSPVIWPRLTVWLILKNKEGPSGSRYPLQVPESDHWTHAPSAASDSPGASVGMRKFLRQKEGRAMGKSLLLLFFLTLSLSLAQLRHGERMNMDEHGP